MKVDTVLTRILRRSLEARRRRPFRSKFTLRVLAELRSRVSFERASGKPLFVHLNQIERGSNPFWEEFGVRFRLSSDPPGWEPEEVESTDRPIGVTEVISSRQSASGPDAILNADFFFQFSRSRSLARNIERFRSFVGHRLARVEWESPGL